MFPSGTLPNGVAYISTAMTESSLLELILISLPFITFISLLVFFIPWPFITMALVVQFLSNHLLPAPRNLEPEEEYLPRLPTEVYAHIASFLHHRRDLVQFTFAGRSMYNAGNAFLYRKIIMDEHPSTTVPWFRRRLYRLHDCLTFQNASLVRQADFSSYADIDEEYLLSILQKCTRLTMLVLPAMQRPIQGFTTRRDAPVIKQPCFLTEQLSVPIYNSITALTWVGPFIPFRGPELRNGPNGREMLRFFPNLRSLTIRFRPDQYTFEGDAWISYNVLGMATTDVDELTEDLGLMAASCPYLEDVVLPFWEPVYSLVSRSLFDSFGHLRRIKFLAIDTPAKWASHGSGLLKFMVAMHEIGVEVSFDNPYQTPFEIQSLFEEIDLEGCSGDCIRRLSQKTEFSFGIGSGHALDLLNRLEWMQPYNIIDDTRMTLRWNITPRADPRFFIPPIFTGVLFEFDKNVRRYDASSFLKFQRCMQEATETSHLRRIRVEMRYVNAFYLAFPLFMQFYGKRVLTLRVERLLLPQRKGWETCWLRRRWKIRRQPDGDEDEVALEELGKDGIHIHPARSFEQVMLGMLFCGDRNIQEISCIFHDRYFRSNAF